MNQFKPFLAIIGFLFCTITSQATDKNLIHWSFDEGMGTTINDATGQLSPASLSSANWTMGVHHAALMFAAGEHIEVGNSAGLTVTNTLSIEAWIKPYTAADGEDHYILNKKGAYAFGLLSGDKLGLRLWIEGSAQDYTAELAWTPGKWQHVAANYDGQRVQLYLDGQLAKDIVIAHAGPISNSKHYMILAQNYKGAIDEIKISKTLASSQDIAESAVAGRYEIARRENRFTDFYEKNMKRKAEAKVAGTLWVDTEDFDDYGGWWMETQFVPQMGSPYLMAAGLGTAVANAKTSIEIEDAGTYRLWVRNKNWRAEGFAPGQFKVRVNGNASKEVFGTREQRAWVWQDGGIFELKQGLTTLELEDLTGYYGRCDALILTKDMALVPHQEQKDYLAEREKYVTSLPNKDAGHFDVVVVGAGVAGINAAIAAARGGASVALVQDRPMVGGNNSAEMGVPVSGGSSIGAGRETGLNEEIGRIHSFNYVSKWATGAESVLADEKKITLFLNAHVFEAQTDANKAISSVTSFDMLDKHLTTYSGDIFIDCTGDGWLAYYAGAEWMLGRESREIFGEKNAKDIADNITMSGSLMQNSILGYQAVKTDKASPYNAPEWAYDLINSEGLEKRPNFQNRVTNGGWWCENHGRNDDLWDPEWARDDLMLVSMSLFDWVKNKSSLMDKAKNYELRYIPVTNAKRETRRIVGDYILKEQDLLERKVFPDRVGYCVWKLDIHNPLGVFSNESPYDFEDNIQPASYPFRILYAKGISNLLMAGRHISVSHVALGSTRVQGTTGQMGQVVGTAAAMCIKYKTTPRGITTSHISELQQQLTKDDITIPHIKNEDKNDLARQAKVGASSSKSEQDGPQNITNGLIRPMNDNIIMKIGRVPNNMWISDPSETMPQWVNIAFDSKEKFNTVYLTFDTNLLEKRYRTWQSTPEERMPPQCVRDYQIQIKKGKKWITVVDVKNNYQRRRVHTFETTKSKQCRVLITATNGDKSARIYEARVYNE